MPWVSILIIVPLVAALVLALIPRDDNRLARGVALVGAVPPAEFQKQLVIIVRL
jgi:NADH:ubiquinone oxidoreductase subunit 4 (subunit M)